MCEQYPKVLGEFSLSLLSLQFFLSDRSLKTKCKEKVKDVCVLLTPGSGTVPDGKCLQYKESFAK